MIILYDNEAYDLYLVYISKWNGTFGRMKSLKLHKKYFFQFDHGHCWVLTVRVFYSRQRSFQYCLLLNWFLMRNFPLVRVLVQAIIDYPFDTVSKKVQKKSSWIVFQMMHKWSHLHKSSAFQWRLTNNPKLEAVQLFPDLTIKIQNI